MKQAEPIVFVVDDDRSVREALMILLESEGIAARGFGSAEAFLRSARGRLPGCLILDVQLPGMSGLDLRERLMARAISIPTVLITGGGEPAERMRLRGSRGGAATFLRKPFAGKDFLRAVRRALTPTSASTARRVSESRRRPKPRRAGGKSRTRS